MSLPSDKAMKSSASFPHRMDAPWTWLRRTAHISPSITKNPQGQMQNNLRLY